MAFIDYLTNNGKSMLAKATAGTPITFTKIILGSGRMTTSDSEPNMQRVITPVIEINVQSVKKSGDDLVVISALFSNSEISESFEFREKGIYISDGKDEVLAIYGNSGDSAELIEAATSSSILQKKIRVALQVSSSEAANIQLTTGGLVDQDDFDALKNDIKVDIAKIKEDLQEVIETKASDVAYGRAIISDVYDREIEKNSAADGMAASQKAVYNVFKKLQANFQAGVDKVYKKIQGAGLTPKTKALDDVVQGIEDLANTIREHEHEETKRDYEPVRVNVTNDGRADVLVLCGDVIFQQNFTNSYDAGVADTKKGTSVASNVLEGKTFTNSSSVNISGTMKNDAGKDLTATNISETAGIVYVSVPETAYYSTGSRLKVAKENILETSPVATVWSASNSGTNSLVVDMKQVFPNSWQKLRTEDFVAGISKCKVGISYNVHDRLGTGSEEKKAIISFNYDNSTGTLTASCKNGSGAVSNVENGNTWWVNYATGISGLFVAWKGTFSGE